MFDIKNTLIYFFLTAEKGKLKYVHKPWSFDGYLETAVMFSKVWFAFMLYATTSCCLFSFSMVAANQSLMEQRTYLLPVNISGSPEKSSKTWELLRKRSFLCCILKKIQERELGGLYTYKIKWYVVLQKNKAGRKKSTFLFFLLYLSVLWDIFLWALIESKHAPCGPDLIYVQYSIFRTGII